MELGIDRLVDHAHPAAADEPTEDVAADPIGRRVVIERHGLNDPDQLTAGGALVDETSGSVISAGSRTPSTNACRWVSEGHATLSKV